MRAPSESKIGATLLADTGQRRGPHDVLGGYVETFWLPVLGPGSIMTARRVTTLLRRYGGKPVQLDLVQLAAELGMPAGAESGKPRLLLRCLQRLCSFDMADIGDGRLWLSTYWPTLDAAHARRLPEPLRSQARPPDRSAARV